MYELDGQLNIVNINVICIDSNIAVGSFLNSKSDQFFPTVLYGYITVESPLNIVYYLVNLKTINLTVRVSNLLSIGGRNYN